MNTKRASGIILHPTSFPGKYGIGDLGTSAYDFIDFLEKSKQKLWQVLPLNPTSFGDSPYQSFSTFAGNSLLISPDKLLESGFLSETDLEEIPNFNNPCKIDYGNVIPYKNSLYKKAYQNFIANSTHEQKSEFSEFCKNNESWLNDYSLFASLKEHFISQRVNNFGSGEYEDFVAENNKYLKNNILDDYYYGAVWSTWPDDIKFREPEALSRWEGILESEIMYNKFIQFEFERQWLELKEYANKKNIKIIGDIPIFVAYDSADTWSNPELYFLDDKGYPTVVAGVPPDYFSATGQLWGNPLYNWANHKKTNYRWWISRVESIFKIVDIVRIDHFRGFEAYWAIPYGEKTAENGSWIDGPKKDFFVALEKALGKKEIIAEDLGIITEEVEILRDTFGFPGMRVLQFAFESDEENNYLPHNYNKNSLVYTGTHDNDTTCGWYRKLNERDRDFFRRYMNVSGDYPNWDLIRLAIQSVAKFALFPLQDLLGLDSDSRTNTPGIASGNWQWRYTENSLSEYLATSLFTLTKLFGR